MSYNGIYGIYHIIYVIIFLVLFFCGFYLVSKDINNKSKVNKIIFISALFLFISIVTNRICCAMYDINEDPVINTWLNVLPHSFCGFSSFVFSLAVLLGKKDNKVLHFILYLGLGGGILTLTYPGDLARKDFWEISMFTSLLHHSIMTWLAILLLKTKSFKPTTKKWYIYPIGYSFMMMIGLFEKDVLGLPSAMNIGKPLSDDVPILTSWWFIFFASCILVWIFEYIYQRKNKSN